MVLVAGPLGLVVGLVVGLLVIVMVVMMVEVEVLGEKQGKVGPVTDVVEVQEEVVTERGEAGHWRTSR